MELAYTSPISPPERTVSGAALTSFEQYSELYQQSIQDPQTFWNTKAKEYLSWFHPFNESVANSADSDSLREGDISFFKEGKINACYNCIDRHIATRGDQIAIIHEPDHIGRHEHITYKQLLANVCRISNFLLSKGVRSGDSVGIYLPNCPEAAYTMLACARIGAIHTVIFAGFSAEALAARLQNSSAKVLVTMDAFTRGARQIFLKKIADQSLLYCPDVKSVLVLGRYTLSHEKHEGKPAICEMNATRDIWYHDAIPKQRPYCPVVWQDSEDTLFLLYTSGSTGLPKGILHTTAGFLLQAAMTHKYVFDHREGDIFACVADVGWITGHTYIVYGPLCNGGTTVMFESIPTFPNAGRYWDLIQRHKVTQFYTAPTAIRALMALGDDHVKGYDRSSVRVLGSVGEPLNPAAWKWYSDVIGEGKCAVVDTYWQTESGGHLIAPLASCVPTKPGSVSFPFFGIEPVLLDPETGVVLTSADSDKDGSVTGVLAISKPWPGIGRSINGDHAKYLQTYMDPYKGYYFTGDRVIRDKDGYYFISGRIDDVLNVSGHRLGTAEIESCLVAHPLVSEAASVGVTHDVKGQCIWVYVVLMEDSEFMCIWRDSPEDPRLEEIERVIIIELKNQVRRTIGAFASPDNIVLCLNGLPKTRSGKIMRRILRKISHHETTPEQLGDISTLADPKVVAEIVAKVSSA
eukprot:TRINITY_DN12594_c0_g1_i1.p1 TRINITY_DN12594_c0_g1~~TRINITY_DN12594_c0_g1_i1.p1  ORF type:complete len:691 (-),score=262.31 TRINITY_DN12594_c0_g1_i1:225-2297(-)